MKKIFSLLILSITAVGIGSFLLNKEKNNEPARAIENPSVLAGEELDLNNAFYDDFTSGINSSTWGIAEYKWGGANGGVRHENVFYDNINKRVTLRALGDHYKGNEFYNSNPEAYTTDGTRTGGVLIKKDYTGPGRYEIRMRLAPMTGVCNAFWTYNGNSLNEIDFELPGTSMRGGTPYFPYNKIICTTWISSAEDDEHRTTSHLDLPNYLNDNEFHNYTFDWYYSNNNKIVIWYLDGQEIFRSTTNVSRYKTRIWAGCWFPYNQYFVGMPDFDTAYMDIDYVSYIPFKNQTASDLITSLDGMLSNIYPTVSTTIEDRNYVANDKFKQNSLEAFTKTGTVSLSSDYDASGDGTYGAKLSQNASLKYRMTNIEGISKLNLSFDYKNTGSAQIKYYGVDGELASNYSTGTLTKYTDEWKTFEDLVSIPSDAIYADITFATEFASGLYLDNVFFGYKGNQEPIDPSENIGDSYGFYLKDADLQTNLGETSLTPDGNNSHSWRVSHGGYYKGNAKTRLIMRTYTESGNIINRPADSTRFDEIASALVAADMVGEKDGGGYHYVGAMYQEYDMNYFKDMHITFHYMSLKKGWERITVLYSIDKGATWNILKQDFSKNIESTGDNYYRFNFACSSEDTIIPDYTTIRFAITASTYYDDIEEDYQIASVVINNKNNFKYNLDSKLNICNAGEDYQEFLAREFNDLTSGELNELQNEMMASYPNQSYLYGYNYLLSHWNGTPLPANLVFMHVSKSDSIVIIIIAVAGALAIASIIAFSKKRRKI